MNRRGFLAAIAGGLVLDPERLLWRPGKKLISIPKPSDEHGIAWLNATFERFQADQALRYSALFLHPPRIGDTAWFRDPGKFEMTNEGNLVYIGGATRYATLFPDGWHVHRQPRI